MFGYHNKTSNRIISSGLLFAMIAGIIIGQILIPYQTAQAIPVYDAISNAASNAWEAIKQAYEKVKDVWTKIQTSMQTAFQSTLSAMGISKEIQDKIKEALKWAFTAFKKKLLDMMADQIINWINGGGKPTFITDWRAFLSKAADDVGGNFVDEYLGAGFLCKTFSPQIQIMLAKPQTFDTAAVCTLSKISTNLQNFYDNFTAGGWKGWLTVSETQNNIYGMYFYALDQKWSLEELAAKSGSAAAQSAAGFLGDQVCLHYYKASPTGDPDDNIEMTYTTKDAPKKGDPPFGLTDANCTEWFTRTPGKVAADALSKIAGKDWDWLLQSTEYSQYIVAIADAVLNRMIKEGVAMITAPSASASGSSFTIDYSTVAGGIVDYKDAAQNGPYIKQLIPQEKLLKENLGKVLTEYQTNLDVLNQIKTVQTDAFNTLKNIAQNNCSLPGGASQQSLGTQTTGDCLADNCPCEAKTVETIKVTAPSFGEATFQTTTVDSYSVHKNSDSDNVSCVKTSTAKTSAVTLGSLSIEADLTDTNNAISKIKTQTGLIDAAVIDLENYQKTINEYNEAYDASQSHVGSQAGDTKVATSTINAMYSAKQKAINSTKAIINSTSDTLDKLLDEIMAASQDAANQNSNATQKRGMEIGGTGDCSSNTGYYKTLCDIKAIKASWDSALDSCLNSL